MKFTLAYHSDRTEVALLYWKIWKQKLWKIHMQVFLLVSVTAFTQLPSGYQASLRIALSIFFGLCVISLFAIYPLAAFKSQLRNIVVDDCGVKTTIGNRSGELTWDEVQNIEHTGKCVYVTRKNLNSYIVPRRAFRSESEMQDFIVAISKWHGAQS